MTPADRRDNAIAALCNLLFVYLLLAGLGALAVVIGWLIWTFGGLG